MYGRNGLLINANTSDAVLEAVRVVEEGRTTIAEICRITGVARSTLNE